MATPEEAREALEARETQNTERARAALRSSDPDTLLRDIEEFVGTFGIGANRGLANILGFPVDTVNFLLRMGGVPASDSPIVNAISSLNPARTAVRAISQVIPATDRPVGGSESIQSGLNAIGLRTTFEGAQAMGVEDEFVNRMAFRVGEEAGAGAVPATATVGLAKAGIGLGGNILGPIMRGAAESPLGFAALEGLASLGGGAGAGIAQEIFPDSPSAEVAGQFAGGLGLATLPSIVRAGGRAVRSVLDPFTASGQERRAAAALRGQTTDPESALANLQEEDQLLPGGSRPDVPDVVFTSAQIANDPGLLALERAIVRKNAELAGRFQEIRTSVNAGSRAAILEATGGQTESQAIADFLRGRVKGLIDQLDARTAVAVGAARRQIDNIRPDASAEDASSIVRREITDAMADARKTENALWGSIYAGRNVGTAPIREQRDRILALANKNDDPANIPVLKNDAGENILENLGDTSTVEDVLALRSRILAAKRTESAADAPNRALLKNLDAMQEASLRALGIMQNQATEQGASQIRAAMTFSRELNDTFTRGPIGKLLGFDARGGQRVPDIETLEKLVRPGIAGASNADAVIRALTSQIGGGNIEGGAKLIQGMEDFIFDRFIASTHGSSGQFDARAGQRFIDRFAPALERFPGIRGRLDEAVRTGRTADIMSRSGTRLQRTLVDARRSRAAVFLDRDVDKAISAVFGAKKPASSMREIVKQARADTTGEATEGLKQGVFEHMIRSVELGALDLEGVPVLSARLFRQFMQQNGSTLSAIYTPAEMGRLRQVGKALDIAERSTRSAITGGSDTAQNTNLLADAMARIVGGTLGARIGRTVGGSPLVAAQVLATKARQFITLAPERSVRELVERAIFEPELMKTLLTVPTPQNAESLIRRLNGHLLNLQLPQLELQSTQREQTEASLSNGQSRPIPRLPTSGRPMRPQSIESRKVGGIPVEFFREQ